MMLFGLPRDSWHLLGDLIAPAVRALAFAGATGAALAVLRESRATVRLFAWTIVLYAALTLLYTHTPTTTLRQTLTVAALTAIWLGLFGVLIALRQTHFEGYLLLLALGLFTQSIFTLLHTLYPRVRVA